MKTQQHYFFDNVLLRDGWATNVRICVSDAGLINNIERDTAKDQHDQCFGTAIPGIPNVHSHAFQRAMAGLTEHKVSVADTFWSWRETMYRFANLVSPNDLYHIASQLYVEMVKMGYTGVAEFHYLHHQENGKPYDKMGELSFSILEAATTAGINITLLPVLYLASGFGNSPLLPEQKRFGNSVDSYFKLMQAVQEACCGQPQRRLGMALHSLRAVPPDEMKEALTEMEVFDAVAPIHIHIAEQLQEVEQAKKWLGKRPVEWLFESHNVDQKWCLIHATHLTKEETSAIAKSGAVVGICPTTEANLGDGIFPLHHYLEEGGAVAIGSDGNTSVSPIEEIRWLEYVQRLVHRGRNIVTDERRLHTGSNLFSRCLQGGSQALGQQAGCIEKGYRADLLVVDDCSPNLANTPLDFLLDTIFFSGNQPVIKDVMISGQWCVRNFRHVREEEVKQNFVEVTKRLRGVA